MTEPQLTPSSKNPFARFLAALGPAIITASVVLGPGSIFTNSKTGAVFGYQMVWFLTVAVLLMIAMTALSTRLGVLMKGTIGDEVAERAGRPFAVLVGVTIFLIASCFQFSNNLGVLAGVEPFYDGDSKVIPISILIAINGTALAALFFARNLYGYVEKLMKILIGLMVVGFVGNLIIVQPNILEILKGFIPSFPAGSEDYLLPRKEMVDNKLTVVDNLGAVLGMFATTFSIAAAYYQSYLVQQKGWTIKDYRTSIIDTLAGIGMLGVISLVIMCTASAAFHGKVDPSTLDSAGAFASQLKPTFGVWAKYLFCGGIFAGAISSFLVNSLIGGAMLSDGCGLGGKMEDKWVRIFASVALLMGFSIAVFMTSGGEKPTGLIIFAQGATVIGGPLVAGVLIWLATRPDLKANISNKLIAFASLGLIVTLLVAFRKAIGIYLTLTT